MGEIRAEARLENLKDKNLKEAGALRRRKVRALKIDAVVDTGAVMMLLPQEAVEALGLTVKGRMTVQLADDQRIELPYTEAFAITVAGRETVGDCLVGPLGCEALIGQLILERLDLIPDPVQRTLTPRPESPFRPTLKLKAAGVPPGTLAAA